MRRILAISVLVGSFDNVLRDNESSSNETDGFTIQGLGRNLLAGNRAELNSFGFVLESGTTDNELIDNTATRNEVGYAITLGTGGNTMSGNEARDNRNGFEEASVGSGTAGTDNTYSQNICAGNGTASNLPGLC